MTHYTFPNHLHELYHKVQALYQAGQRDQSSLFTVQESSFLAAHGLTTQTIFDYIEDETNYGEPGWNTALSVEMIRRDYFLSIQAGRPSPHQLEVAKMPGKSEQVRGIEWLPRLIVKTKAKLRGELPSSLMYGCAGDRAFFRQHDIHPAEFLSLVWRHENDDAAIIDWVARRSDS